MVTPKTDDQSAIIRTGRGLTIVGTRITLYDGNRLVHEGKAPIQFGAALAAVANVAAW